MKKIAFTGAHGVGKTTLTDVLVKQLSMEGLRVAKTLEVPRLICDRAGDPTFFRRGNNTPLRQILILLGQVDIESRSRDLQPDLLICDRTLLDHWAYTKVLFGDELQREGILDLYEQLIAEYCLTYDRIFYLPIEFPPVDDGTRESDSDFQHAIDATIVEALRVHELPFMPITGTVEERLKKVRAAIES